MIKKFTIHFFICFAYIIILAINFDNVSTKTLKKCIGLTPKEVNIKINFVGLLIFILKIAYPFCKMEHANLNILSTSGQINKVNIVCFISYSKADFNIFAKTNNNNNHNNHDNKAINLSLNQSTQSIFSTTSKSPTWVDRRVKLPYRMG